MSSHSAFFYGTLMAPQVLHRVCHGTPSPSNPLHNLHNLRSHPAILHSYRRHRVAGADYPAILPCPGASVRGTYVTGLTDGDIWRLDIFEGEEYARQKVRVKVLVEVGDDDGKGNVEAEEEVEVETYVWIAGEGCLEEREWDFGEFQREKMRFWVGAEGQGEYAGRPSIVEVDEAVAEQLKDGTGGRGANGHITRALDQEHGKDEIIKNAA